MLGYPEVIMCVDYRQPAMRIVTDDADMRRSRPVRPLHKHYVTRTHVVYRLPEVILHLPLKAVIPRLPTVVAPVAHLHAASLDGQHQYPDAVHSPRLSSAMPPLCPDVCPGVCDAFLRRSH